MGKIIKTILATEDNDPMGLLNTYEVFNPKKYKQKYSNNHNLKDKKIYKTKKKKII
ncbi:hypothetical protein [Candidatus Pelagibacter communis]|uniref:hypothetical protein n=1 Tax=Pelagibacter ubique TaxID=198252 RepID=UPI00065B429F|nr:hypothetical protein [Candidatus Pelagibacter ubique]